MAKDNRSKPTETDGASLPDAELEVLASLWKSSKATARQVREAMADYRPMSHGAMVTLLKRLQAKGLVSREKGPVGKAFIYRPTKSAKPTYRRLLHNLVQRVFGGNGVELVANLLDAQPPTPGQLERLHELLDDLDEQSQTSEE